MGIKKYDRGYKRLLLLELGIYKVGLADVDYRIWVV